MTIRLTVFTALLLSMATPALSSWETQQSNGIAQAIYTSERYQLTIGCSRGSDLRLTLEDKHSNGEQFDDLRGLMMWLTLPDLRTDRWPVDVTRSGPVLTGTLAVSDFSLSFFQNSQHFRLDSPITGVEFLRGDMVGTGAARLAFKQQCNF